MWVLLWKKDPVSTKVVLVVVPNKPFFEVTLYQHESWHVLGQQDGEVKKLASLQELRFKDHVVHQEYQR